MIRSLAWMLLAVAPVALAGEPADAPASDEMQVVAEADTGAAAGEVATDRERRCIRDTGTRIASARDRDGCTALPGDAYDRDDIDRSGAVDTADAIRKLSPSATLRR